MMTIIGIFFFYGLITLLIHRIIKKEPGSLSLTETALAFGYKVLAGCAYGYIFLHYYGGDDTWAYQQESLAEYQKLVHQPIQFFKDLLPFTAIQGARNTGQLISFYIMDLEYWLMVKTLAVFNIFSRGNYYINTVFFNFISFWGHYCLFSLLLKQYPSKRKQLFICIFFIPTIVFWLSGIRADGYLFFFISLLLLHFYKWVNGKKKKAIRMVLLSSLGILILRNVLLLLLVPPLLSWYIVLKSGKRALPTYIIIYVISMIIFFGSIYISASANFPSIVVKRQQEYFQLKGNTRFQLDSLHVTATSFIKVLPQAVDNTFLRPYLWESKGMFQIISALEIVVFWLLVILFLFKGRKKKLLNPVFLSFLLFGFTLYLFIGYTVPFPGAIVRYKIIGELLLILPLIANIQWVKPSQ